jgi:hypothetical protein
MFAVDEMSRGSRYIVQSRSGVSDAVDECMNLVYKYFGDTPALENTSLPQKNL